MVAKAKASSSCLSFLKDALLLPSRNVKLFIPVLLLTAATTFLLDIYDINVLRINEVEVNNSNTNTSSVDYEKIRQVLRADAERGFIGTTISAAISIFVVIIMFMMIIVFIYSFAIKITTLFAASTTYSGDRYSLLGLFSKVILKGRHLSGPLITFFFVTILNACTMPPLSLLSLTVMRHLDLGTLYMTALSSLRFVVFLYLDAVLLVAIAVSVADTHRRGASALWQAWQLMTRVSWKQGLLLVVVHFLKDMSSSRLHGFTLAYTQKSMPMGIAMLAVYALLSGLMQIFYFTAATVYSHQAIKSMKSREVMAA